MCTAGRQGRLIQTPLCVYGREDDTLHVVGGLSWWSLKAVCSLPVCPSPPSVSPPPSLSSSSRLSRRCPSARLFRSVVKSPVKATHARTHAHTLQKNYHIEPIFRKLLLIRVAPRHVSARNGREWNEGRVRCARPVSLLLQQLLPLLLLLCLGRTVRLDCDRGALNALTFRFLLLVWLRVCASIAQKTRPEAGRVWHR